MGKRIGWALAALTLAGASAGYGFLVHRSHFFPYHLALRVYQRWASASPSPRWQIGRPDPNAKLSAETIGQLANLPYLQGYRPSTGGGVRMEDRSRIQDGWNLYTSGHAPVVTLMDIDGKVVKTWTADAAKTFPGLVMHRHFEEDRFLRLAHLYPDGGIVTMFSHIGLVRLDAASRVVWAYRKNVHHDFSVTPSGAIWVLEKEMRSVPGLGDGEPVWEDFVEELSPEGRLVRRISLLEALRGSDYAPLMAHVPADPDLFHSNSIEVLDGSLASRSPIFRMGNVLVSLRDLDLLAILDPDQGKIVWSLSGQWHKQHAASLLPSGRMLLFDNFGTMRAASRVLEVDPFTQEIIWSWGGKPGQELFSESAGGEQRLDNGNTLIWESNFGRAVEVTPEGRVVWEFINPNRAGAKNELIATLYKIERLPKDLPFLARVEAP